MTSGDPPFGFSHRAHRTHEQPISYLMAQAVDNPHVISLAGESLRLGELAELELFTVMPGPYLAIDNGPATVQGDEYGHDQHQR